MNELAAAIEVLQSKLSTLDLHLDFLNAEFQKEVDSIIERNKRSKSRKKFSADSIDDIRSWQAIRQFRDFIRDELMAAVDLAKRRKQECAYCHRLAIAIDCGKDHGSFVIDAIRELDNLKAAVGRTSEKYPGLRAFYEKTKAATPEAPNRMIARTYAAEVGIPRSDPELIKKIEIYLKNNSSHGKWTGPKAKKPDR